MTKPPLTLEQIARREHTERERQRKHKMRLRGKFTEKHIPQDHKPKRRGGLKHR